MIAEILDAEPRISKVTGRDFIAFRVLYDGEIKYMYLAPQATRLSLTLIAFCGLGYNDLFDIGGFIGKLIPVYAETREYLGRTWINLLAYNVKGMEACLRTYPSLIEDYPNMINEDRDDLSSY